MLLSCQDGGLTATVTARRLFVGTGSIEKTPDIDRPHLRRGDRRRTGADGSVAVEQRSPAEPGCNCDVESAPRRGMADQGLAAYLRDCDTVWRVFVASELAAARLKTSDPRR
jgi:hypothetical protein